MRNLTLMLAVVLFSSLGGRDAAAEWTKLGTTDSDATLYIDFATIRTSLENSNWKRVWTLLGFFGN